MLGNLSAHSTLPEQPLASGGAPNLPGQEKANQMAPKAKGLGQARIEFLLHDVGESSHRTARSANTASVPATDRVTVSARRWWSEDTDDFAAACSAHLPSAGLMTTRVTLRHQDLRHSRAVSVRSLHTESLRRAASSRSDARAADRWW